MTCIVGVVAKDGRVVMGADSCGSNGYSYSVGSNAKICRLGGEHQPVLLGACGSFRMMDVLRHDVDLRPMHPKAEELEKWIRKELVVKLRAAFKSAGVLKKENEEESIPGSFLLATEGHLFEFQRDLSIIRGEEWGLATGSGVYAARGALHALRKYDMTERDRVKAALSAAEATITTVRGPWQIEELKATR